MTGPGIDRRRSGRRGIALGVVSGFALTTAMFLGAPSAFAHDAAASPGCAAIQDNYGTPFVAADGLLLGGTAAFLAGEVVTVHSYNPVSYGGSYIATGFSWTASGPTVFDQATPAMGATSTYTIPESGDFYFSWTTTPYLIPIAGPGNATWVLTCTSAPVPAPSPGSGPMPVHQSLPLPLSGKCVDVVDRDYAWGTGVLGGWQIAWEPWVGVRGGWACSRALVYSSSGHWIVDNSAL